MKSKPYVLLINPRMCRENALRLPLSLLALAAGLQDRYQYQLIDGNVDPNPRATALRALADHPNALVGVSVMPGPQVATAIQVSTAIRDVHPHVPIVWGGYFPTLYPNSSLNAAYVDYLVRGQGGRHVARASRAPARRRGTPERSRIDVESRRRPGRGWAQLEAVRRDRAQS